MARLNNRNHWNVSYVVSLVLMVCGAIGAFQYNRQGAHRMAALRPQADKITYLYPTNLWGLFTQRTQRVFSSFQASSGPAILERETTIQTKPRPEVLERPATQERRKDAKERVREGGEAWEVRIYNDGMNTREHVARSLVQITGMTEMSAYQTMMQAHQNGIASVGRFCFEIAEMYHEGLRTQGIISDIVPVDEDS